MARGFDMPSTDGDEKDSSRRKKKDIVIDLIGDLSTMQEKNHNELMEQNEKWRIQSERFHQETMRSQDKRNEVIATTNREMISSLGNIFKSFLAPSKDDA